jgi:5-methylcytosine-specific restriction endonuclease McrA
MVCEICGKKLNKKVRSDAKYRFCSHKCAGKAWAKLATQVRDFQGEKNPAWRGGITPENHKLRNTIEYDLWRNAVFARDNWTCQKCGIRGHVLHSHHIKPFARFPEFRTSIENGLTVCNSCHRKIHKKYGN